MRAIRVIRTRCPNARLAITIASGVSIRYTTLSPRQTYRLVLSFNDFRIPCPRRGGQAGYIALLEAKPDAIVSSNAVELTFPGPKPIVFILDRVRTPAEPYLPQPEQRRATYVDTSPTAPISDLTMLTAHYDELNGKLIFGDEDDFDEAFHAGYTWPALNVDRIPIDTWISHGPLICARLADIVIATDNRHVAHISQVLANLVKSRAKRYRACADAFRALRTQLDLTHPINVSE